MPDWQGELDALLARLDVSLENETDAVVPPSVAGASVGEVSADDSTDDSALASIEGPEADPLWASPLYAREETPRENEEVSAVRSEIEATLSRIVALARAGQIERSFRDDVVFVLHALMRPRPHVASTSAQGVASAGSLEESAQEWQLASAAAVLRFCRIVLRLSNVLASEPGV
ncbi:MAG: hypothetical protein IVW57_00735 [Ktedonobacterales bacterium]|nr:hypothetical protein [Ktedonobacterales bacterium]